MSTGGRDGKRSFSDRLLRGTSKHDPDQQYGIKTFYEPVNSILDIVFVHGITGHREHSWSAGQNFKPWPETLLPPKIPDARILSFGYDGNVIGWRSRISSNNISDHARNLLASLAAYRDVDNSSDRPIIFVAHSLGGLVCQDALLSSRAAPEVHLQKILESTWGILFLGTPHFGTGLATIAKRLAQIISPASGTNLRILEVLRRDSEVLSRIQNEFHSLLRSRRQEEQEHRPIEVTCFYEEVSSAGIGEEVLSTLPSRIALTNGYLDSQVVPKYSAVLPGYPAIGIHSNHRDMARFATADDPGFISVAGELQRWAKEIRSMPYQSGRTGACEVSKSTGDVNSDVDNKSYGDITIWGDVVKSNVVNGNQNIYCGLTFKD